MSVEQIVSLIVNAGISAACLVILGKWTARQVENYQREATTREQSLYATITRLDGDLRTLEKEVRTRQEECLDANREVMEKFAAAMENFTKLMAEKYHAGR